MGKATVNEHVCKKLPEHFVVDDIINVQRQGVLQASVKIGQKENSDINCYKN